MAGQSEHLQQISSKMFGLFPRIRCELTLFNPDKVNILSLPTTMGATLLPWQRLGDSEFRCDVTAGLKLEHTWGFP